MKMYDSFTAWMVGRGNRGVVACLQRVSQIWHVHGDTRVAPVMQAYEAFGEKDLADPFVVD